MRRSKLNFFGAFGIAACLAIAGAVLLKKDAAGAVRFNGTYDGPFVALAEGVTQEDETEGLYSSKGMVATGGGTCY